MYSLEEIQATDPEIAKCINDEVERQNSHIELIASENWVSKAVMAAMGSPLTNKYAEGYPGRRYYGGCQCIDIVEDLAKVFGGEFMLMHAPARVSGKQIKEELLKEDGISKIIRMGDKLDVALVGIGVPNSTSAIMATGYYDRVEMNKMREKHVAGDICMQFYDINGSTTPFKIDNNVVGIEIKKLRRVPHSIGVACGIEKVDAIKGAINGKYINTLVTDVESARKLIEEE